MNSYSKRIARLCVALATLVASFNSPAVLACTDVLKHTQPSGDIGKMLLLLVAFYVCFAAVLRTLLISSPDWISLSSASTKHKEDEKSKKNEFGKPDLFNDQVPWGN